MQAALVPLALAAPAVSSIAGGVFGLQQAQGEKQRAETNAYIGRTRAVQTNVNAREGLNEELATMRATFATNAQKPGVGTMEVFDELRRVRGRERRVEFGNQMAQAADWKMAAKNASAAGTGALLGGFLKAGPSLFDLYDYNKKKG